MANIAVGHYRNVSHQPVRTDRKRSNVETDTCFPQPPSFGHDNLSDRIDAAYSVRERKRNFRFPVLATDRYGKHVCIRLQQFHLIARIVPSTTAAEAAMLHTPNNTSDVMVFQFSM